MKNDHYLFVARLILNRMFQERADAETISNNHKIKELKEAYMLLADLYDSIIVTIQKHIAEHEN